ncbi:RloB family protein [Pseudomonas oryzihabitans]|uniref:RloB family protein n=1 Tax=Pseudomonas oryzihabitans TaxID=47885 RepID=UPI00241F628F|nr:RloB family protein [Pseudomonas oryzihabitans]
MTKNTNSFRRKEKRYKAEPKILVICEDKKSSKIYLEEAATYFRVNMKIIFTHCGKTDPLGIIQEAVDNRKKYDHIYCVIDRDTHQNFREALDLASQYQNITPISSYPCFEFWLIIHFGHCTRPFRETERKSAGDQALDFLKRKEGMDQYAKGSSGLFKILLGERFETARRYSPRILARAIEENERNPSTELHILIDKIEELSAPQPIEE